MRRADRVLSELKVKAWRNGVRLFRDACTLFGSGGYPSSYALGVLALEEAGKVYGLDRVCDCMCLNPESADEWLEWFLSSGLLRNHRWKQESAFFDSVELERDSHLGKSVSSCSLERAKHKALYVELEGDHVLSPSRVTEAKALALLRDVLRVFESGRDIAFFGFHGDTTMKSEWQADELVTLAREALDAASVGTTRTLSER